MLIKTMDFGQIEVDPGDILSFPEGVYAFSNIKKFVLLNQSAENGIVQLQAVESEKPRFIMLDPFMYIDGYNPVISEETMNKMQVKNKNDLNIFIIAVIPEDFSKITVNLKSPVLINFKTKYGVQCITENDYPTRYALLCNERTDG